MNLLRRPQLSSAAPRLGGLSPGFKPSTRRCRCLGASRPQANSSWSGFRFGVLVRDSLGSERPESVCEREVTGIQFRDPAGRTGLITLETPSAASAQEIPQLPGTEPDHQGRCLLQTAEKEPDHQGEDV